ncbi:MAG TPA: tetratricopeptide repeat protein [Bacteroidales bacterium]|nr:tetratricopeptide repeat protein [Bacteroidales bacterium]
MKKLALVVLAVFVTSIAFSQNTKVVSAYNYLKNGQLDKAKTYIDEACVNDQTKGLAKTWFYCGNIYLSISLTKEDKYKTLDTNATQIAYDAYQKAIQIDPEISNEALMPNSPKMGLYFLGDQYYNKGVDLFYKKQYTDALTNFEMTKKINNIFGVKDSNATFNAGLCAVQLKDNKKAKGFFEELVKNNFKQGLIYTQLSTIYKAEGDTVKSEGIIAKGRKAMPNDLNLIIAEINNLLSKGKVTEAQDLLNLAVSKDPNNATLHFAIGANMDEFGNFEQAEKSYLKAIELKPEYFDAHYNLGALYVNTAANVMDEANKLPITETAKYDELKTRADNLLEKALPELETAEKLNPKDRNTLITLKQLYARKGNAEKIKEYDEKISKL